MVARVSGNRPLLLSNFIDVAQATTLSHILQQDWSADSYDVDGVSH